MKPKSTAHLAFFPVLLLALLASAAFAGPSQAAPSLDDLPPHPRLFLTQPELAALRADCLGGSKRDLYGMIRRYAERKLPRKGPTDNPVQVSVFAFVYLIEEDMRFGKEAVLGLMRVVRQKKWYAKQEGYQFMPMVYDHIYPLLTRAQIDSVIRVARLRVKPGHYAKSPYYNLEANAAASCVVNGITFFGDGDASSDRHFRETFVNGFNRLAGEGTHHPDTGSAELRGGVLRTRLHYARDGGYHKDRAYTCKDLASLVHFAEAMRALGLFDAYAFARDYYVNVVDYLLWITRPDGTGLRQTTGQGHRRLTPRGYEALAGIGRQFRLGKTAWMIDNRLLGDGVPPAYEAVLFCILWDPMLAPEPPTVESMGTSKAFNGGAARYVYRSGWDVSPESRDFVFHIDASDYMGDNVYWTVGGFEIFYRGALAIKSGNYAAFDDHYGHYNTATISANCVIVRDDGQKEIRDRSGQDNIRKSIGRPEKLGDVAEGSVLDRARIDSVRTRVAGGREWSLVSVTLRPKAIYVKTKKAESWIRRVLVTDGIAVIYDRVKARDADFPISWLLHTVEEPVVSGAISDVDVPGHISWHAGDTFHVTRSMPIESSPNGGNLHGTRLLPRHARTRKVGGDGYSFWVDSAHPVPGAQPMGRNFEIGRPEVRYSRREAGAWRLEIHPIEPGPAQEFLVALQASDEEYGDTFQLVLDAETAGFVHDGVMLGFSRTDPPPERPSYRLHGDAELILLFDLAPRTAYRMEIIDESDSTGMMVKGLANLMELRSDDRGCAVGEIQLPAGTRFRLDPLKDALP